MPYFKIDAPFCISVWNAEKSIGSLKWTLLWGEVPFLEKIWIDAPERRKGFGTQAMTYFESMLARAGHTCALVSTRADEDGQHFFRKLGYADCGALDMHKFTQQSAAEIFLFKTFKNL